MKNFQYNLENSEIYLKDLFFKKQFNYFVRKFKCYIHVERSFSYGNWFLFT